MGQIGISQELELWFRDLEMPFGSVMPRVIE